MEAVVGTLPLFAKWFFNTETQTHFGRQYSWRNSGCREITSISSVLRRQTRRDTLSGVCLSERNRVTHVKSGLHTSQKPSCFDSVLEIVLRISRTGASKGCFPFISDVLVLFRQLTVSLSSCFLWTQRLQIKDFITVSSGSSYRTEIKRQISTFLCDVCSRFSLEANHTLRFMLWQLKPSMLFDTT